MQYKRSEYDAELHQMYPALSVKQPYASFLVEDSFEIDGVTYGVKQIEVRKKPTKFRGDLLICASKSAKCEDLPIGVMVGFVELYDCKPVSKFNDEDWAKTQIPPEDRAEYKKGYGWYMRNPRKVVELPVTGQLGIFNLVFTKDTIVEYPKSVILDKKAFKQIMKKRNG